MSATPDRAVLDHRVLPAVAIAIPVAAIALGIHLTSTLAWLGGFELAVTAGLAAAALATVVAVCARVRWLGIATAGVLLLANTAFVLGQLAGARPLPLAAPDARFGLVLAAGTLLGVAGLVARRHWARWLCLALGAAGVGSGGLNAINYWDLTAAPIPAQMSWYLDLCKVEWTFLVTAIGGALIVVNLVAARAVFVAGDAWSRPEPVVRALRLTMIAAFVAVPMLLVYAWMQPLVPATATSALVIAAALTLGAVLAVRGKLVGALVLVLAGGGLVAQTLATVVLAEHPRVALYYVVFWTPAAVLAIVSGALLARPTLRLLRGR
jgi:hypothetical protein